MNEFCAQQQPTRRELTEEDIARIAREHGRAIYRSILKRVRNPSDAEDILQNSLCVALRVRSNFMWQSAPETWLCGIALNLVRTYFARSAQFRYQFESDEAIDDIADEAQDPADIITRNETTGIIARDIESMPEDMRKTLILVTEENHSYEQAAAAMGVPIGTVRSRIFRARAFLKKTGSHEMLMH